MIAKALKSQMLDPLRTSDTGHYALSVMADFHLRHLPIVNNQQLLGLISEDDILDHDPDEPVGSYKLSLNRPIVKEEDHLFDVMSLMAEFGLSAIPVIDGDGMYSGVITLEDLLQFYAKSYSFVEPGSIIVLSMRKRDYSLVEISQIIESENAAILSTFISSDVNSENVIVTIKVNKQDISNIISSFERYEYDVKATFTETDFADTLKERYDLLMSYLNV
jgi:CBS domain-containing protein